MIEHRALISVWNKDGIEEFAKGLSQRGWQLLSSSGTARRLEKAGVPVKEVADSRCPHILGKVKTLHPAVIGSLAQTPLRRGRTTSSDTASPCRHSHAASP